MKRSLLAVITTSILGLAYSTSAMAALTPFEENTGDGDISCGFKNDAGKVVIAAKYDSCGQFHDGLAYVGIDNGSKDGYRHVQGFIDQTGKLVIPVKHEAQDRRHGGGGLYQNFSEGLFAIYNQGYYGYMDKQQKLVIPYKYDEAGEFSEGLAVVVSDDFYGAINKAGKLVVPTKYAYIGSYSEGIAPYSNMGSSEKLGYISNKGEVVLNPKWGAVEPFSEGLAAVAVEQAGGYKWGVIDTKGNYIVQPKYDQVKVQTSNEEIEGDSGRYKKGVIYMYDFANKKDPYTSKIIRHTLDKAGKLVTSKTYNDWEAVEKDYKL